MWRNNNRGSASDDRRNRSGENDENFAKRIQEEEDAKLAMQMQQGGDDPFGGGMNPFAGNPFFMAGRQNSHERMQSGAAEDKGMLFLPAQVGDNVVEMMVDTGAQTSVFSRNILLSNLKQR